jgi:phage baseplate assembly protein W
MKPGLYRGYSSHEYEKNKTFSINDIELVKLDILSHIYTRKTDRVMMPNFGTRIPDMIFEPLDGFTLAIIEEDLRAVVAFDPRVELLSLTIAPQEDNNAVTASLSLLYVELNMVSGMDINIAVANT